MAERHTESIFGVEDVNIRSLRNVSQHLSQCSVSQLIKQ